MVTELHGNRASVKKFKVDMKRISEWRKLKEAIAEKKTSATGKNRKRLSGRRLLAEGCWFIESTYGIDNKRKGTQSTRIPKTNHV